MQKNYDKNYIVYSDGRIFSVRRNIFLKPTIRSKNASYFCVGIYGKLKSVHRIVAETFIPNPYNCPKVNHINGIKTDNRIENLEWTDTRHNTNHFYNSKFPGVYKKGNYYQARITLNGKRISLGYFQTPEEASNAYIKALKDSSNEPVYVEQLLNLIQQQTS